MLLHASDWKGSTAHAKLKCGGIMTFRERIEWLLRMGLLVFVLAAAAFLSAVTAMRFAIQGREVDMPNLVGKSSADAQAHPPGTRPATEGRRPDLQRSPRKRRRPAEPSGGRAHEGFPGRARRSQPGTAKRDHSCAGGRKPARGADSTAASRACNWARSHRIRLPTRWRTRFCSRTRRRERAPRVLAWICWWRKASRNLLMSCHGWWACHCRRRIGCFPPAD